ncbi:MAG TPA: DJ-1/PfpI family protein [Polyangia bacterium]|nr:DJ-1/PfpI family protein [Polyangia bacterium]
MRIPLFDAHPTLRPPRGETRARVLAILAPTEVDLSSLRALWRRLRRRGIALVAANECHGEVQGAHRKQLCPNELLLDAAADDWDAVVVGGGPGALTVAEDGFARDIVRRADARGRPIAALGLGRAVVERAGSHAFVSDDPRALADWLCQQL